MRFTDLTQLTNKPVSIPRRERMEWNKYLSFMDKLLNKNYRIGEKRKKAVRKRRIIEGHKKTPDGWWEEYKAL